MEQKKINRKYYTQLNEIIRRYEADSDKATDTNDSSYYVGFADGMNHAKKILQGLNRE